MLLSCHLRPSLERAQPVLENLGKHRQDILVRDPVALNGPIINATGVPTSSDTASRVFVQSAWENHVLKSHDATAITVKLASAGIYFISAVEEELSNTACTRNWGCIATSLNSSG